MERKKKQSEHNVLHRMWAWATKKTPKPKTKKHEVRPGRGKRRFARTVVITLGVLFILNFALAPIILYFLNKKMADMPEYVGHIDNLALNIFAGSATVYDVDLKKKTAKIPDPFFYTNKVHVGIEWKSLFKGRLVAKIDVDSISVNFVQGPTKETSQTSVDKSWLQLADDLMPITINRFELHKGEVHFKAYHKTPKVDIYAHNIYVLGENLGNVHDSTKVLPSTVTLRTNVYGGSIDVKAKLDAMAKEPKFDVTAQIKKIPLPQLNSFTKAYAKMDIQKGWFSLYAEAASKDNKIKGYAKPFVENLDVLDLKEEKDDPLTTKLWEGLVDVASWFIENHKEDNIATKIEIQGDIKDPNINVFQIIGTVLKNAFIQALFKSVDNTVSIENVGVDDKSNKNFLEKVFGKKDRDKPKKDKPKKKDKKRKSKS